MLGTETYDYLIIGGGIFGVYAAIFLAGRGSRVLLIEKEAELFTKASVVNQARLHAGYHYPRSIATAMLADAHKERFVREHQRFVNHRFDQYYAIERYGSVTNADQFKRFCDFLEIQAKKVDKHELFRSDRLECIFLTEEYSFDPYLIAEFYKDKLKSEKRIDIKMNCTVIEAENAGNEWNVKLASSRDGEKYHIKARSVINATYSSTNTVNGLFGMKKLNLTHEITEMAIISSQSLQNVGLTVMDGHFCSIMPYGLSNMLSLSSVTYTHHKISQSFEPVFDCQDLSEKCRPNALSICNRCSHKPMSNYYKMICQLKRYISDDVDLNYMFSMYTVKTKLQACHIDDGRPTEISLLNEKPAFYCLFAGKINSIYEIESEVSRV